MRFRKFKTTLKIFLIIKTKCFVIFRALRLLRKIYYLKYLDELIIKTFKNSQKTKMQILFPKLSLKNNSADAEPRTTIAPTIITTTCMFLFHFSCYNIFKFPVAPITVDAPNVWADWGEWSMCSRTCGGCGIRSRVRSCRSKKCE